MSATTTSTSPHHTNRKPINNNRNRPPHPSNPNQPPPSQRKKSSQTNLQAKSKRTGALDFIDTLDTIGGFHHDGPFDAASSHRNRNMNSKNPARQAPMAAFDPSALVMPPPPTTAAASTPAGSTHLPEHVYPPVLARRGSDGTLPVSMGYPAGTIASDPKAARLAEAFGIPGREAWEDFCMERSIHNDPDHGYSGNAMKSSRAPKRVDRDAKTASVWDMEATLRSGKPVPSEEHKRSSSTGFRTATGESDRADILAGTHPIHHNPSSIKRSKSLMQRIKKGVKSPNLPIEPTVDEPDEEEHLQKEESFGDLGNNPISRDQNGIGSQINPHQRNGQPTIGRKASLLVKFGLGKKPSIHRG